MVKNIKLSGENIRWHLRTLNIAKAQNINSAPRISSHERFTKYKSKFIKYLLTRSPVYLKL